MKALKFLGNRVEDAANAFIDVLKYSDQSVDYPDFKDIEPWPEDIVNMFKDALKDKPFSEISAILMYTQQSSRFEPIAELMLGIGLVEMRHYDKLSDFLQKADPHEQDSVMDIYPKVEIGFSPESALKIAWNSEIETIGNYKKIMNSLALYSERADYDDVMYLLNKLIADEEHHIKLIKENMRDARNNGKLRGSSCKASRSKLSKSDLAKIFRLKSKGLYYKDIGRMFGVSSGTIGRVINRKSYRDENID
jgi:rubrerythrin